MRRDFSHNDIAYVVTVNVVPNRKYRWSYETTTGLFGKSEPITCSLEFAFREGRHAAEKAIEGAVGK